mgnify:CR=1 FL=1
MRPKPLKCHTTHTMRDRLCVTRGHERCSRLHFTRTIGQHLCPFADQAKIVAILAFFGPVTAPLGQPYCPIPGASWPAPLGQPYCPIPALPSHTHTRTHAHAGSYLRTKAGSYSASPSHSIRKRHGKRPGKHTLTGKTQKNAFPVHFFLAPGSGIIHCLSIDGTQAAQRLPVRCEGRTSASRLSYPLGSLNARLLPPL